MKRCCACKESKAESEFNRNQSRCRPCHKLWMRHYRRTLRGFLDQKYTAMSKRVRGKDRNCAHLMTGMPIVPRDEFIGWAYLQPVLPGLFAAYEAADWDFKLCPTIDRIDPSNGYMFGNMQFITQSENSKRKWL